MDLEKIKTIIRRKPLFFLLTSLGYLLLTAVLKWTVHPAIGTLMYVLGGLVGIYFLDIAEVFFNLNPSPFRSMLFVGGFVLVSLFVVTSSTTMEARGLVLSLYLTLVLWQTGQWQLSGNLDSWYALFAGRVTPLAQRWLLIALIGIFVFETISFVW
jgi:hypothetical protein